MIIIKNYISVINNLSDKTNCPSPDGSGNPFCGGPEASGPPQKIGTGSGK